jgi:hypothetical protein
MWPWRIAISSPAQDLIDLLVKMSQLAVTAATVYRCGHSETKCKAVFKTKEALQQHQKSVHTVPKPLRYACGVPNCTKAFEQHAQLVQHTNAKHRSKSAGNNVGQTQARSNGPRAPPPPPRSTTSSSSRPQSKVRNGESPGSSSSTGLIHSVTSAALGGLTLGSKVSFASASYRFRFFDCETRVELVCRIKVSFRNS